MSDSAVDEKTGHPHGPRLEELEARFAFLDDQVHQLDAVVAAQSDVIDRLRQEVSQLTETIKTMRHDMPDGGPEPPPPHY